MVSLKSSFTVKPAENTPKGLMYLSEADQTKAITHAPTVYFYEYSGDFASTVNILKDSLSKALVIFYPLAGRLRWIGGGRLELDCNSMGALFLVAESEAKIEDFGDFRPTPQIRALIPSVDYTTPIHELPLLLVQLTKFSCGGISLGIGISHVIVDGEGALHFISNWAKTARCDQIDNPPFLDRTILQANETLPALSYGDPNFDPSPLLIGHRDDLEERKKESTVAMLRLTKEEIDKLKDKANEGRITENMAGHVRAYSRYEAVAGHMWRCACEARGHASQQRTRLGIAVDFRNRIKPALPQWYFGNAVIRAAATSSSGELLSKPLWYASSKIREATEKVTNEYVQSYFVFVKTQQDVSRFRTFHTLGCTQGTFFGNPNMEITSWARLPVFGGDFGWGKEIHMGPGALGFDGKSFILPSRDEDGSFLIALRLQVSHMDAFKKLFYHGI